MGKGSRPRPLGVTTERFSSNWDNIFGNKPKFEPKTYIVDIDETICHSKHSDYANAIPYTERIAKINELVKAGHTVIYWTARGANSGIDWSDFTREQLTRWGCMYDMLHMNKPAYDVWIDDKALNAEDFF